MQTRAYRANRTVTEPRRFLVAQFFQFAEHDRFPKLCGQLQHCGTHELSAFLLLGPMRRAKAVHRGNPGMRAVGVWLVQLKLAWSAFNVLHDAIARNPEEISGNRA